VGTRLRRLRKASNTTRAEAGAKIRASQSKISRLESGRTGFKQRDVADLLTLYGVTDDGERASLLALAGQANAPSWWQDYMDVVDSWSQSYLGLEQAASIIRTYDVQFIPNLLQTQSYARAAIQLCYGDIPDEQLERRVSLRMERQHILHRQQPPKVWVVIDEAALRRPIGGAASMRSQIRHLIEIAHLPRLTVQVMPFSVGGHPAAGGPIAILRFPEDDLPDVVYLEQLTNAHYPTRPDDIKRYWHIMNRLVIRAEPPTDTMSTFHRILKEI
jgi:transcriptional regulator with XRE-family HTH domain